MQSRSLFEEPEQAELERWGIARRVSQITVSAIKQMPILAAEIGGCVSLGQGIPSFNTPRFIREAVIEELKNENSKISKYSMQPGMPELKEEIARDLARTRGIEADPDANIFVSCGGMEALAAGISTVVERADEVILPAPCYASHIEQVLFAEAVPVFVPLSESQGWRLLPEQIRQAITKKTKAIVISNPVNPTGTVFSEQELRELAQIVLEHKLYLISDEAYDFLTFDQTPYFSLLSLPEMQERIIACCSFSKRYCMTGWRVGFMCAHERIIKQVLKVHDAFAICAPSISQFAALIALRHTNGSDGQGDLSMQNLRAALLERRDLLCSRLDQMASEFEYVKPVGGYYVFPRLKNAEESLPYALRLLREAKVISIPGLPFGPAGEGHIRFSFGAESSEIIEACGRLEKFLEKNQTLRRTK